WFQLRDLAKRHDITAFSSNYALYADLSERVMRLLARLAPHQEVYSIDECFLEMTGMADPGAHARQIRQAVRRDLGIPVCVGIATSKTLAKLANHVAKKHPELEGVCDFNALDSVTLDALLAGIAVGEVWGVGRKSQLRLQEMGIADVLALKRAPAKRIRAEFGVVMERTHTELNGIACLEMGDPAAPRQQIICSRSFGAPITALADLEQAVIAYTSRAAEKLRRQHSLAASLQVYIRTNPHQQNAPLYQPLLNVPLGEPTADTRLLCRAALYGLRRIYRPGMAYQKAGVALCDILPGDARPRSLFDDEAAERRSAALMETLDAINRRMGSGTVRLLGEGVHKGWAMKRGHMSQRFTTEWDELAVART
ncbi:MAG: Y-family DNA polymerase, partial [Gallionella sp.]|nr:Y-family DNA polymerase [Gallionella sp.]